MTDPDNPDLTLDARRFATRRSNPVKVYAQAPSSRKAAFLTNAVSKRLNAAQCAPRRARHGWARTRLPSSI